MMETQGHQGRTTLTVPARFVPSPVGSAKSQQLGPSLIASGIAVSLAGGRIRGVKRRIFQTAEFRVAVNAARKELEESLDLPVAAEYCPLLQNHTIANNLSAFQILASGLPSSSK